MPVTGNNILNDKSLSIRVTTDGFSFFTPQGSRDFKVEKGVSLAEELDKAIKTQQLLKPEYREVNLVADSPATRVPLDEFRSEDAQSLYCLTFGDEAVKDKNIHYEVLPGLDVVEVFPIDTEVEKVVTSYFPDINVHGIYGQLLLSAYKEEKRTVAENRRMYVALEGRDLFLFNFSDGRLAYANTFATPQSANRLYFTLYVWNQQQFDQEKDTCIMVGEDDELKQSLAKYIRNIQCV